MKCPKCGTENNDTAKFCKNCGEKLGTSSSQDTSSQVKSSPVNSASEPKDNKKLLKISVAAIICLIIIAGALALNSSDNSGISSNANSAVSVDSSDSSSGYYQYDYRGYTFNIPNAFSYYNDIDDNEYDIHTVLFKEDDVRQIAITVAEDFDSISDEDFEEMNAGSTPTTMGNINGLLNRTTEGDVVGETFVFRSGSDIIWVIVTYIDDPIYIAQIISSIQQNEVSHPGSSSSSEDSMTYSEASSYLSGASSTVIQNTFDEADANGDGLLTGSEITKFKNLADLTERTADTSNTENVEAQDYGAGDGTTRTRYCTTHGRVAVGEDNLCPYCLEEGLDARTVKGSTEYI